MEQNIECLVADTAALIKGARLDKQAQEIVTIREVVDEVRDKNARRALSMLPFELTFKQPSEESIKASKFIYIIYI